MLFICVMIVIILTNHFQVFMILTLSKGLFYKGLYNLIYLLMSVIIIRLSGIDYCCTSVTEPWNRKILGFLIIKYEKNPLVGVGPFAIEP